MRGWLKHQVYNRMILFDRLYDRNTHWPPQSTDFTSKDFFLWRQITKHVYTQNYHDVDPFKNPIAAGLLQVTVAIVASTATNLVKCPNLVLKVDGCRI